MNRASQARARSGLFAVLCAASIAAPSAALAEPCGTVVAAGATVTLTANVGPCDGTFGDYAITVEDGGTLDLNGKTVTCQDLDMNSEIPSAGIVLHGSHDHVINGTVDGCAVGVLFSGDGYHTVETVTATNGHVPGGHGFAVEFTSPKNRVTYCTATNNAGDGFNIGSDRNSVTSSSSNGNGAAGFNVIGNKNRLLFVTAGSNATSGVDLGGIKNKLTCNAASNGDGVVVNGEGCGVRDSTIANNADDGLVIAASAKALDNTVSYNAYGIRVQASAAKVKIARNDSSLNSVRDMTDEVAGCGDHRWTENTFATSNDACIH
ncbi:MAG TPA: hypothetical protein VN634_14940 [Candidatus Limnocylindrales bacterium]|nr:hypothetical protein [Candidatus Limnocylindrales bacterium]